MTYPFPTNNRRVRTAAWLSRREFLFRMDPDESRDPVTQADDSTKLTFLSTVRIAQLIREKKVSSVEVVQACYERIDQVNPMLNAIVQFCRARALKEAGEADQLLARGQTKGPLHGVPMTIKDSIDTAEVISTGGTLGRAEFVPQKDATVVQRLRQAGAILLGKTNTPEFTLGGIPGLGTIGNIIYGMSRNPYDTKRSTQGSSGGAGAIVAAGGAYFDIGSDFGGSIRNPAHACGIAGIKPTTGRVPRTGHVVDYGGVFDAYQQLGPLARRVEDLIYILPVIMGPDFVDAAIVPMPWLPPEKVDLKKLRIAFYTDQGGDSVKPTAETEETVKRCVQYFTEIGCPAEAARPPRLTEIGEITRKLGGGDGNAWLKRLTDRHGTKSPSPGRRFDQPQIPTSEFTELMEQLDAWRREMLAWVKNYDLILCPNTWRPAALIGEAPESTPRRGGGFAATYNHTGWPAGVVRAGTSPEKMPIGIHVIAQPWREDVVLAAMQYIESKTGGWVPPPI